MRSAFLRGRDHNLVGVVEAVAEGNAAVALSRGGAAKVYDYVEPNEDAAGFAVDAGGGFAAVADGHHGAQGAEQAVEQLLRHWAPSWTATSLPRRSPEAWCEQGLDALLSVNAFLFSWAGERQVEPGRTTLSFVVVRPDQGLFLHASAGDSHIFRVGADGRGEDVAWSGSDERPHFLGYVAEDRRSLPPKCRIGCESLADVRALVLASDGLSEHDIGVKDPEGAAADAVARALPLSAGRRPIETARGLVETALGAHRQNRSGDNAASAVLWTESAPGP